MTTEKQVEKGISDIVGALRDLIIVYPGGWGNDTPEWVKNAITLERLAMNMKALKGEVPTATDAEACAYLMSASLSFPLDHDWTQIYLYVASQTMRRWKKTDVPADIDVKSLNDDQMRALNQLKEWIYRTRTRARQESDRADRRQAKEEKKQELQVIQQKFF